MSEHSEQEGKVEKATREYLAKVAREMALAPFHGAIDGLASNLAPIVRPFPTWSVKEADGLGCAAIVLYCCKEAGFEIRDVTYDLHNSPYAEGNVMTEYEEKFSAKGNPIGKLIALPPKA